MIFWFFWMQQEFLSVRFTELITSSYFKSQSIFMEATQRLYRGLLFLVVTALYFKHKVFDENSILTLWGSSEGCDSVLFCLLPPPSLHHCYIGKKGSYPASARTEQMALGYTESIANHLASIRFHFLWAQQRVLSRHPRMTTFKQQTNSSHE